MKFLVLSACVALSSCSLVTHPNGAVVPADTPAVAAARLSHFHAGGAVHAVHPVVYGAAPAALVSLPNGAVVPADAPAGGAVHHAAFPYAYGFHGLVAHPNGAVVPAEPADVVAARAEHLAALAKA